MPASSDIDACRLKAASCLSDIRGLKSMILVSAELVGRVEHGKDVFRRDVGLDVVDLVEHVTAVGAEGRDPLLDVLADFLRRGTAQDGLGIAAAAPEDQAVAELALEPGRLHVGGRGLHRVENVDPRLDEMRQQVVDRAARVQKDLPGGVGVDPVAQLLIVRLEHFGPQFRPDELAPLRAAVVGGNAPGKAVIAHRLLAPGPGT